jgi:hypothetical protein
MLISRHTVGESDIVARGLSLMWKSNVLIVMGGMAILAVFSDTLVALASGSRFTQAGMALLILFMGLGATSQGQLVNMGMQIHDHARALRTQSLLFLLVPLAAWAGAAWGITMALAGIVLAQWLRNVFAMWWMRRHGVAFALDWNGVGRQAVVTVLAVLAGMAAGTRFGPWAALALVAALLVAGTLLAKPLSAGDGELLGRVLKGRAKLLKPFVYR